MGPAEAMRIADLRLNPTAPDLVIALNRWGTAREDARIVSKEDENSAQYFVTNSKIILWNYYYLQSI